ncbi:MAG: energy-coupling factor transporter transmembrane component T, partial [Terrisporobacter sp.]
PLSVALGAAFGGVIFGGLFISQNITTGVLAVVIGGQIQAFTSLFIVSLKLLIISLSTICIFTSVDPEKLSDALLKFGLPAKFGFGISYGYRMIPILIDEYNNIFNSFRLRGQRPKEKKVWGLNIVMYYIKILMKAFYPMILNTAKRIRSTVEALETKGFTESIENPKAMELKLSYMAIGKSEYTFLIISTALVGITLTVGNLF